MCVVQVHNYSWFLNRDESFRDCEFEDRFTSKLFQKLTHSFALSICGIVGKIVYLKEKRICWSNCQTCLKCPIGLTITNNLEEYICSCLLCKLIIKSANTCLVPNDPKGGQNQFLWSPTVTVAPPTHGNYTATLQQSTLHNHLSPAIWRRSTGKLDPSAHIELEDSLLLEVFFAFPFFYQSADGP